MRKIAIYSEDDLEKERDAAENGKTSAEKCETDVRMEPYEAYVYSMQKHGKPDMEFILSSTGKTLEELVNGLDLYQDPMRYDIHQRELEDWYPLSSYMFNQHIPRLYKEAESMNQRYPGRFERNLEVLKKHYPKLCGLTAYDLPIGNRMVPNWLYEEIFRRILDLSQPPSISYNTETQRFTVHMNEPVPYVMNHVEYGTKKKGISDALSNLMNEEEVVVKEPVWDIVTGRYKQVKNESETVLFLTRVKSFVNRYYQELGELMSNPEVYEQISELYCDSIGGYFKCGIRCDWVKVPGLETILRDYQKDGIGRAVMNPVTFFAWGTGAGKSLGMLAAASEMKRLGICRKILMVIPNGSLENFVLEIEKYFPNGNYLIIYPKQFSQKKAYYLETIAASGHEYDAVIMAVSSYMMLDMTKDYYLDEIEKKIRKTKAVLNTELVGKSNGEDAGILKRRLKVLEKQASDLREKEEKITDCFDRLGFDGMFSDECQEFKNVTLRCNYTYIKGVSINGSAKCDKHVEKVHWILRGTDGTEGRVVFATATPQKNSISETYVWQKYLSEDELSYAGMHSFHEWMKNFTEAETKPGVSQDLQSMTLQTRLKYHNLTDLHGMMSTFMHFHRTDQSNLKLPKHGPYVDVVIPATESETVAFELIAEKLNDWHNGLLTAKEYNPLMATLEGRAISSDIRLIWKDEVPERGTTKSEYCTQNVFKVYHEYPDTTQVVFCDISVPKEAFNLYDEMKKHMIKLGIPADEIAFIHDAESPAKKKKLLAKFQTGKIRVLIGSTQKMGIGLNIHNKLKAVHHFDCPFSPADLIQRNGRAIREGNENEEVLFFRYIKERSYDAVSWERVEMKQGWIEAFNSSLLTEQQRDMDDLADNSLSYGEAVAYALGKPEMRKYVETENEIKRVLLASRKRAKELQEMKEMAAEIPNDIAKRQNYIQIVEADMKDYAKNKSPMTDAMRKEIGASILDAINRSRRDMEAPKDTFQYQGFQIRIPALKADEEPYVKLYGNHGGSYRVKMETDKPVGCCQILNHYLGTQLEKIKERHEKKCMIGRQTMRHIWSEIEKGNPHIRRLEALREELDQLEKELNL